MAKYVTFPLNNTDYKAEDMQLWHSTRGSGVFSADGELETTFKGGMMVTVSPGRAWMGFDTLKGVIFGNMINSDLTVDMADGLLDRKDYVVIKYDIIRNETYLYIKKGTESNDPQPPILERNSNTAYELAIAEIDVQHGTIELNQGLISDKRLDESVCGIMRDGVTSIPTASLQAQWDVWFETTRDSLSDDIAGNLLSLVNINTSDIVQLKEDTDANTKARTIPQALLWSNDTQSIASMDIEGMLSKGLFSPLPQGIEPVENKLPSNSVANWSLTNGILSESDNVFLCVADGTKNEMQLIYIFDPILNTADNKFFSIRIRVTNSDCTTLILRLGDGGTIDSVDNPIVNTWYTLSGLVTNESILSGSKLRVYSVYYDSNIANGKTTEIKEKVYYNVTLDPRSDEEIKAYYDRIGYKNGFATSAQSYDLIAHGKNFCFTDESDWEQGSIDVNTGQDELYATRIRTKKYIRAKPNTNFSISIQDATLRVAVRAYDANLNYARSLGIISGNFATQSNDYYFRIILTRDGLLPVSIKEVTLAKPQLEEGNLITAWEEYVTSKTEFSTDSKHRLIVQGNKKNYIGKDGKLHVELEYNDTDNTITEVSPFTLGDGVDRYKAPTDLIVFQGGNFITIGKLHKIFRVTDTNTIVLSDKEKLSSIDADNCGTLAIQDGKYTKLEATLTDSQTITLSTAVTGTQQIYVKGQLDSSLYLTVKVNADIAVNMSANISALNNGVANNGEKIQQLQDALDLAIVSGI